MYRRSGRLHYLVAVIVVALLSSVCVASAQGYGTGYSALTKELSSPGYGTPNLQCAEPWAEDSTLVWGEVRSWEAENWTFAAGARTRTGEDMDAELTLFTMDTSGEDRINEVVRDSEATLLGLNFKWVAHRKDQMTIAVIPGVEVPIGDMEGTNTQIPATAVSDDIIPVLAIPLEFISDRGTVFRVVPRYVGFDEAPRVDADTTINGFGDLFALAAGALHETEQFSLMADVAVVLEGDNSIDVATNAPTDELVWSAGGAWHAEDNDYRVDAFLTNAAGPTAATSIIATPDQSVGLGLRVSGEF
ncbi:MAG: hypothetical protein ACOC7J_05150 [Armatimonadota bacterium]